MSHSKKIEIKPIGFVNQASLDEKVRDKSLVSRIFLKKGLAKALDGVEEFSHVFILYWMHAVRKFIKAGFGLITFMLIPPKEEDIQLLSNEVISQLKV